MPSSLAPVVFKDSLLCRCTEGGSLIRCEMGLCPKSYHLACIGKKHQCSWDPTISSADPEIVHKMLKKVTHGALLQEGFLFKVIKKNPNPDGSRLSVPSFTCIISIKTSPTYRKFCSAKNLLTIAHCYTFFGVEAEATFKFRIRSKWLRLRNADYLVFRASSS